MLAIPCWMVAGLLMVGAAAVRERLDLTGHPMIGTDGQPLYEYDAWATWKINWFPNCLILLGGAFILAAVLQVLWSLFIVLRFRRTR